jgi:hypothetical protein
MMDKPARFIHQLAERVPIHGASRGYKIQIYNTASESPEPGDLFWLPCASANGAARCHYWDNCEGRHLYGVLPNGHWWNIDGRARNCALPNDRLHRCWIRHGRPEDGDVDKAGLTCAAGAGSIDYGGWHGHLTHGHWVGSDWVASAVEGVTAKAAEAAPAGRWNPLLGFWEPIKK